jgi:hypothetical protein
MSQTSDTTTPPLLRSLADNRQSAGYGLLLAAAVLIVLTVMASTWWVPTLSVPIVAFGAIMVLATLVAGLERLLHEPAPGSEVDAARVVVLAVGGLAGLALAVASVLLAWLWWSDIFAWLSESGPGKQAWRAGVVLGVLVAGLLLMFSSLQIVKTEERSNAILRRMLYGYNVVLTALLLLAIVALVNILVATRVKAPLDFTASANYTLNPRSIGILQNMSVPTEIMLIPGFRNPYVEDEVRTLLANCQQYTDKIKVSELNLLQDQQKAAELQDKYAGIERGSLLLTFKRGDKEDFRLISQKDLMQMPDQFDPRRATEHKFTGEDVLITALSAVSQDKELPVVYFTQGHNELDLNDAELGQVDTGCGVLKRRLEEKKTYQVKALKFDQVDAKVPKDASLVIIAGPRVPFSEAEARALREYMSGNGRMIVLLDVVLGVDKKMVPSGLEGFLSEYGIQLRNERMLTLKTRFEDVSAVDVIAGANPELVRQRHPLAYAFRNQRFLFRQMRPLRTAEQPMGGKYQTSPVLVAISPSFADTNFTAEPSRIVDEIHRNPDALRAKVQAIEAEPSLPALVAVSESNFNPNPMDPHARMRNTNSRPRLIVFGNANCAANRMMDEESGFANYALVASSIEWLRDRPANIGIEPKKRDVFAMEPKTGAEGFRMVFLPLFLVVTSILGLATGVWVVRRR